MHIALVDRSDPAWSAGGAFTEMMVRALRQAGGPDLRLSVLSGSVGDRWQGLADYERLPWWWRYEQRLFHMAALPAAIDRFCLTHRATALVLADDLLPVPTPYKKISWVPDFQHRRLPELFSQKELKARDAMIRRLTRRCDTLLLSSNSAQGDLQRFFPRVLPKSRVLQFPSMYAFKSPGNTAVDVLDHYHLPAKFALVANQFWAHKNHLTVIDALAGLALRGIRIPVVLTGLPSDYRDPANSTVSAVLQRIAASGLSGQVIPLGLVPFAHLTELLRRASVVVQPSLFEGWSTVVQDAVALGRPLICSDIAVHHEQASDALGYFACDNPNALADLLASVWPSLTPGPDLASESRALEQQRDFAVAYGKRLLAVCGS